MRIVFILFCLLLFNTGKSQDTVFLKDSRIFSGKLTKRTNRTVTLIWKVNGTDQPLKLRRSKIDHISGPSLITLTAKVCDTLTFADGIDLIGKVVAEDDEQYFVDQYQEQLVHFSVLKSGVEKKSIRKEPPYLEKLGHNPTEDFYRLSSAGFFGAYSLHPHDPKISSLEFGAQFEKRFSYDSRFSFSVMPGFAKVYGYRLRPSLPYPNIYYEEEVNSTVLQLPVSINFMTKRTKGFIASAGVDMHTDGVKYLWSDSFKYQGYIGPKFSLGYALRIGFGDTMRIEFFISQKQPNLWQNGLKLSFVFGRDRYVERITELNK